jgi:alpha-D-ribose 1-methylphosphonate 5-phosphate C-P lyase
MGRAGCWVGCSFPDLGERTQKAGVVKALYHEIGRRCGGAPLGGRSVPASAGWATVGAIVRWPGG